MRLGSGSRNAVSAALLLGAIGIFIATQGLRYSVGTVAAMGPGFMPLILGVLLVGLAVLIAFERGDRLHEPGKINRVALYAILGGLLSFALLLQFAGLVPATIAMVFIAGIAEEKIHVRSNLVLILGLLLFSWLVFVKSLQLPMPFFGGI